MGFKVSTSPMFWRKVKLRMPAEAGGIIEGDIVVQFRRKKRDEVKAFVTENAGKEITSETVEPLINAWRDLDLGEGQAEFSTETLKRLEQMVASAPAALYNEYVAAHGGAREGN